MKVGDRVEHESGWKGIVSSLYWSPPEVVIEADDPKLSGEYSTRVFRVITDEEDSDAGV